jgi:hypothetical protein
MKVNPKTATGQTYALIPTKTELMTKKLKLKKNY